jgi:hypothetical protein
MGITMLDTSIFGALNRANSAPIIAKDLLELSASGEILMVGNSSFQEILNTPDSVLRNTQLQQIKDFRIQIQSPTTMAERVGAISDDYINATVNKAGTKFTPKSAGLEAKDLPVVSDVKVQMARTPNQKVKFFTVDRLVKNNITISKAYGIEFSERARPLSNLGERIPYNPQSLGIKPSGGSKPRGGGGSSSGPTQAAAKAGATKPVPNTPIRPGGSGTSIHTAPGKMTLRLNAAKNAFKFGISGALSASNLAAMIPDLVLALADKAAVRDALRNIQTKFIKEGFAVGVSAALMAMTQDEVDMELKNRITYARVRGLGDPAGHLKLTHILQLAEACENYGVDLGYYWGSIQPDQWRNNLRREGMTLLGKQNYSFDERELFEYRFINTLAYVLRHRTDAIIRPAIRFK